MMISNMRKPAEAEAAPEEKPEPEKAQVIDPGEPDEKPEPTIQAPERKPKKSEDIDAVLDDCRKYID